MLRLRTGLLRFQGASSPAAPGEKRAFVWCIVWFPPDVRACQKSERISVSELCIRIGNWLALKASSKRETTTSARSADWCWKILVRSTMF